MRTRHLYHGRRRSSAWPAMLLSSLLALFFVSFLYAGYMFAAWGRAVAAEAPDMPALALPRIVRPAPANESVSTPVPGVVIAPAETPQPRAQETPGGGRVTVILMGVDNRPDEPVARTDTIMLLTINTRTGAAGVLSLPRDMQVHVPALNSDVKINTVHVLGEVRKFPGGGPGLLRNTVAEILGYPIDYYVRINFDGFRQIIDLIGGVDIDVPKDIRDDLYPDNNFGYDPLYIPKGRQHMDGALALKYARTRHPDDDYGRAGRQQQVLVAVKDKLKKPGELAALLPRLPGLALTLANTVQTDMPVDKALSLVRNMDQVDLQNLTRVVVDRSMGQETNDPKLGFVLLVDPNKLHSAARAVFADGVEPAVAAAATLPAAQNVPAQIARLLVLNGSAEEGLAAKLAAGLRTDGYNVVGVGNAERGDYSASWLIVHGNQPQETTRAVLDRFGISPERVRNEASAPDADLTLILGADQIRTTVRN